MKLLLSILTAFIAVIFLSNISFAQDAVKVDPKHYKVEFENDQIRVLRITYASGEQGVMHSHPEGVVIFLSDAIGKLTHPDGKADTLDVKKGFVTWAPAITHQGENVGDESFEVIQIEMKNK